ncbi:MAG: M20/M25/M40 family metallo-hydrolase [Caldilineaceae bacterium]|nr:M20/M25/M40 family metallo-hydrolase [Caldilineaceae bacterium]
MSKQLRPAATTTVPEPNLARAFDLVMQMMAIPGKTGDEDGVATFITEQLLAAGAPATAIQRDEAHRKTATPGNTGNLILKLPGTQRGSRRLLSAHMDTVPICVGSRPVREGRLVHAADPHTGLGADDRAGATAILGAALEILEHNLPHPPLTFGWFIQEEVGLQGAKFVSKSWLGNPRLAFNWDGGSAAQLAVGATGAYRTQIIIEGLASHAGGAPEKGISAIAIAARAIADLDRNGWHGLVQKGEKRGTSNVGFIHGGEATNVVTDRVELRVEARSHDTEFRQALQQAIEAAFHQAVSEVQNVAGQTGKVIIHSNLQYESFVLAEDEPCVLAAEAAIRAIGHAPKRLIVNGGLDANWLTARGIPSVTLGCGQRDAHTVKEALDLDDFEGACRVALRLATATEAG